MRVFSLLSVAALAAAMPMSVEDYAESLNLAKRQVSEPQVDDFAFYVQHAGAAYCNTGTAAGSAITCGGNCPEVEANGVYMVGTFSGSGTGIAAHVALDPTKGEIILSVRGSSNILNWITNINFAFKDTSLVSGGQFHTGFLNAWEELTAGVTSAIDSALASNSGYRVVATGHSLGGAVATIAAAHLRAGGKTVDTYTYGAPRVGNDVVSDFITNQGTNSRVTHLDDPVPRLPPIFVGYRHTSPEYWLSNGEASGETYPPADIRVCTGNENVDCNASTGGLNLDAHGVYFGPVSSCSAFAASSAAADEDVAKQVDDWSKQDIAYVKGE